MGFVKEEMARKLVNRLQWLVYAAILLFGTFLFLLFGLLLFKSGDQSNMSYLIEFAGLAVSTGAFILLFFTLKVQQEEMQETREVMAKQLDLIKLERRMATFAYFDLEDSIQTWEGEHFCVKFFLLVAKNPLIPTGVAVEDQRFYVVDCSPVGAIFNEDQRFEFSVVVREKFDMIHELNVVVSFKDLQHNHYTQRILRDIETVRLAEPKLMLPLHLDSVRRKGS